MNYWVTHFIEKVSSKKITKSSHHNNSLVNIPHGVIKAFRSPTIVISTVELSDCSFSLLLHKNQQAYKDPLCDIVIASIELSCQCLEPEDCNGTDHRVVRYENN